MPVPTTLSFTCRQCRFLRHSNTRRALLKNSVSDESEDVAGAGCNDGDDHQIFVVTVCNRLSFAVDFSLSFRVPQPGSGICRAGFEHSSPMYLSPSNLNTQTKRNKSSFLIRNSELIHHNVFSRTIYRSCKVLIRFHGGRPYLSRAFC